MHIPKVSGYRLVNLIWTALLHFKGVRQLFGQINFVFLDADDDEDGWSVVIRNKRKKDDVKKQSVYDRLTASPTNARPVVPRAIFLRSAPVAGRLMCPRSAMDLPQTKVTTTAYRR